MACEKEKFKYAKYPDSFKTCLQQMAGLFHILVVSALTFVQVSEGYMTWETVEVGVSTSLFEVMEINHSLGEDEHHKGGVEHDPQSNCHGGRPRNERYP